MNAIAQLKHLPETRAQSKTFVDAAIGELLHGDVNVLDFWVRATIMADTLENIKKSTLVKRLVLDEAYKYKGQTYMGCKVDVVNRKSFKYDNCNYAELTRLKKLYAETGEAIEKIENMLKGLIKPVVDEGTGEVIQPPVVTEVSYVTIK